jgi:hypothetical protein
MKPNLDTIDRRVLDTPIRDTLKLPKKALQDWIKQTSSFSNQDITASHNTTSVATVHTREQPRQMIHVAYQIEKINWIQQATQEVVHKCGRH